MTSGYDVAILGGGLVGTGLALALAGTGFSVVLVDPVAPERHLAADFDGRAYAIAPGSMRLLQVLGVWDGIAEHVQPVRRIVVEDVQSDPHPPAALHFDPAEIGQSELGWIVEDRHLRTALLSALGQSSIDHRAPGRGDVLDRGTGWAHVSVDGADVRARLVIACDGRMSATARAAGIEYLQWGYDQIGLVSAILHECAHDGLAHQSFFAGGPFAVLPLQGDRSSLVWSERALRATIVQEMPDQDYCAEIATRIGGRLGRLELDGKRWSHPLGLSLAAQYCVHRLAVAGDAAHGVHPIAGQGLNMGLRDVAALTEVLAEAARRGEDIGAVDVLERYQIWRRPDASLMALGMDGLTRLFSTSAAPAQALRNMGLGAVAGSGAARRGFMGMAAGTTGDVPKMLQGRAV